VNKISWPHVEWYEFFIHLRSPKIRHFGMVEATELKVRNRGHLQCHDLPTSFHNCILIASKLLGETHRQVDR